MVEEALPMGLLVPLPVPVTVAVWLPVRVLEGVEE